MQAKKWQVLNGNALKLIAAFSMLMDHMGVLLFPDMTLLRIIGRLAFPIFAFMIAEGCCYTKNKLRHFLLIFGLGVLCQLVYFLFSGDNRLNILITFSGSVLLIYALQAAYEAENRKKRALWALVFALGMLLAAVLDQLLRFEYSFWGMMVPVLVSFARMRKLPNGVAVLLLGMGLVLVSAVYTSVQNYAFLALPLLLLYSGNPGKHRMKYFFYIFYPAHLALLEGVAMLLAVL